MQRLLDPDHDLVLLAPIWNYLTARPDLLINASDLLSFVLITPEISEKLTINAVTRAVVLFVLFSAIVSPVWIAALPNHAFLGSRDRVLDFITAELIAFAMTMATSEIASRTHFRQILAAAGIAMFIGTRVFAIVRGLTVA